VSEYHKDLVVLVADKNMEATVRGLLPRYEALQTRSVSFDIFVHSERDPGCFLRGHDFLRPMAKRYAHGLIMFDRDGSGQERKTRIELERVVTARLAASGWDDRAAVVVLDPELEIWVWSDSPHVDRCLGWEGQQTDLRTWLTQRGVWTGEEHKPRDPKDAMEQALRHVRRPRSSSIYSQLAGNVSVRRCQDAALLAYLKHLQNWFGEMES